MDSYRTIRPGGEASAEVTFSKSRFIAQLAHVETPEEAASHLASMRSLHHDARHNVPAWILADGTERASDDGEPQHTAGMPTLEVLRGAGVADVSCVTTRYFGGTLLGTGGLVRAYQAAVAEALDAAAESGVLVGMEMVADVRAQVSYAQFEQVRRLAESSGGKVVSTDFAAEVTLAVRFRAGDETTFAASLADLTCGSALCEVGEPRFAEF